MRRSSGKVPPKPVKKEYSSFDESQELRLNKYLAEAGYCSRRKADELIAQGKVKVNRNVVSEMGFKVKRSDFVTVEGDPVSLVKTYTYILLNKPKDTLCSASDEKGRKTVFDIVRKQIRLFTVGRLDRNTTGVLLLTNDGELANRLTHPSFEIQRTYNVGLNKPLKFEDAEAIVQGVDLEDGKTGPCELFLDPEDNSKLTLVLTEGKNREVRRIFEHFGYDVRKLDRKFFAGITNKGLARGEYRHLERKEILDLKKLVGMK